MNGNEGSKEGEWVVKGSKMSKHNFSIGRTMNEEVFSDALKQRDQDKALIRLSIGVMICTSIWSAGMLE